PTFDAINPAGVKPNSASYDTVGLIARTVPDAALGFAVMTHSSATLPTIEKPRIGFYRTPQWSKAEACTMAALEDAAARLAKAGAQVREITMPGQFDALAAARAKIGDFESSRALAWERRFFAEQISEKARKRLDAADSCTLDEFLVAQKVLAECRRLLEGTFRDFDVLLVPSAPGEAPEGLASTGDAGFNQMWTALHTPTVTVPVFKGPKGLPMGAQFVGPYGADYRTLACAEWAYRALGAG